MNINNSALCDLLLHIRLYSLYTYIFFAPNLRSTDVVYLLKRFCIEIFFTPVYNVPNGAIRCISIIIYTY